MAVSIIKRIFTTCPNCGGKCKKIIFKKEKLTEIFV